MQKLKSKEQKEVKSKKQKFQDNIKLLQYKAHRCQYFSLICMYQRATMSQPAAFKYCLGKDGKYCTRLSMFY